MLSAVAPASEEIDQRGPHAGNQQKGVLGQPRAQRKRPEQGVRVQDATLRAVHLLPDSVEQGHVFGWRLVEIEVQMRRQQLVFEHGI